jgi:hypothetical protein
LDSILDGLSDALNGAVATAVEGAVERAVRHAVSEAVKETLQAVITEVVANPDLVAAARTLLAPDAPTPADVPADPPGRPRGLFRRACDRVKAGLGAAATACGYAVGQAAGVKPVARAGWQLAKKFKGRVLAACGVGLAVLLSQAAAPLPLHPGRGGALLGEGGGVEDEDAVSLPQLRGDLTGQFADQRALVPGGLAEELLQALPLLVVEVGDALGVLAPQVGDQPGDVVVGVGGLGFGQGGDERLQEALQAREHPAEHGRADLRVVQQLLQADAKSLLHDGPLQGLLGPKESVRNNLGRLKTDTVKLRAGNHALRRAG